MTLAQEFIDLAEELFADGADADLRTAAGQTYDPKTLGVNSGSVSTVPTKVVFVSPQQSTTIEFDTEMNNEDYGEKRIASVSYRGPIKLGSTLHVAGVGDYTVFAVAKVNPTGETIYQRVKLGR